MTAFQMVLDAIFGLKVGDAITIPMTSVTEAAQAAKEIKRQSKREKIPLNVAIAGSKLLVGPA